MASGSSTLGTVVDVVQDGTLLVESPERDDPPGDPPLGEEAVDQRHQAVGEVVDVVGPVRAPYFLVEPADPSGASRVVGKELYAPTGSRGDG